MTGELNKLQIVAISMTSVVLVLILLLVSRLVRKKVLNQRSYQKLFKSKQKFSLHQQSSKCKQVPILPTFPYKELTLVTKEYIQPSVFTNELQMLKEFDSALNSDSILGGTINLSIRYDVSRSFLIVVLLKGSYLFASEEKINFNYYITTKLFPQKHKSFQSRVHKTTVPVLNQTFHFRIPLEYLLLQSLKLSLWSFDRFSHHEIVADGLLQLSRLEKYGLTICREVLVSQKLRLIPKVYVICGEIFLSLGYLALTEKLAVIVIEVTNLPKTNDKLPDPSVEVTLIRANRKLKTKSTSIKSKNQNPKFNETLAFDVPAENLHETSLSFSVLNKNENCGSGDIIGKVFLGPEASGENFDHWDDVRTGSKPTARWHKLRK